MVKALVLVAIIIAKTWVITSKNIIVSDSTRSSQATDNVLQVAIDNAQAGDTLLLKIGRYEAIPKPYRELICGNCIEPLTTVLNHLQK